MANLDRTNPASYQKFKALDNASIYLSILKEKNINMLPFQEQHSKMSRHTIGCHLSENILV